MERFRTCDECSRHVRAGEAKCPFCGHALEAAALMQVPRAPAQLSRAQRIALVAAVAGGLAACGDDAPPNKPSSQGVAGASAGTNSAAGAGAAAGSTGAAGTGAAGRGAAGQVAVPVYGAPVIPPYGISPLPPQAGSGGSAAGQGGGGGAAAGQGGSAGTAGQGGSGGAAGKAAAAGSGGVMVQPLYGASPAYGLPPTPPKK